MEPFLSILSLGAGAVLAIIYGVFLYFSISGKNKDGKKINRGQRLAFGILGAIAGLIVIASIIVAFYFNFIEIQIEGNLSSTVEVTPTLTSEGIIEKRIREYISSLSDDDKIFLAWDMLHFEYQQYWAGEFGKDGKEGFVKEWKFISVKIAEISSISIEDVRAEIVLNLDYSPNNSFDGAYKICLEYNNDKDEWLIYRHRKNELGECTFNYSE